MNDAVRQIAVDAGLDIRSKYGYYYIHTKPDMFDLSAFAQHLIDQCISRIAAVGSDNKDVAVAIDSIRRDLKPWG